MMGVYGEVDVSARPMVFVGVEVTARGQLDLEHPHEPAAQVGTEQSLERGPVRSVTTQHLAGYGGLSGHGTGSHDVLSHDKT
jgi:hypothetical protein